MCRRTCPHEILYHECIVPLKNKGASIMKQLVVIQ